MEVSIAMKSRVAFLILVLIVTGCGTVSLREGRKYFTQEEYARAIEAFANALNEDPDNPKIHRDLGIAYHKEGQYEEALEELEKAREKLESDGRLAFYLGLTYEQLEEYDKAIEEYSKYIKLIHFSRIRRQMQQRIQWLTQQEADQWAKERIKLEKYIVPTSIPDNTIAVTYFKPIGVPEELKPLHKGLTALLITDLSMVRALKVVERTKLKELYDELGLSSTALIDKDTAPRIGRLLGANSLVTGTFTGLGKEQWRIDPRLGQVKIGSVKVLEGVEGSLASFVQLEKDLVLQVLDSLDIEFSKEERSNILSNIPTESLESFLAYCRGLDHADAGEYTEAVQEFQTAVAIDPQFDQAKEKLNDAKLSSQPVQPIAELTSAWSSMISQEELRNEILTATVESVSQVDDTDDVQYNRQELATKSEITVDIEIHW